MVEIRSARIQRSSDQEGNAAAYRFTPIDIYSQVVSKVFTYSLNKTYEQYQKV